MITDENEILKEVVLDSVYNFEGSGVENQRVYGMSYDGELDIVLGEHRMQTSASNCFIHSGSNLFLTIQSTAACVTSTSELDFSNSVRIYPIPSPDFINVEVSKEFKDGTVTIYNLLGALMMRKEVSADHLSINLSNFANGDYLIQIQGIENTITRKIQILR